MESKQTPDPNRDKLDPDLGQSAASEQPRRHTDQFSIHKMFLCTAIAAGGAAVAAFGLQPLRDDRGFFPPYQAAPVVRTEVLEAHPELRQVLELLGGRLDDATMHRLNFEVDEKKRRPSDVAHEFLESHELLGKEK